MKRSLPKKELLLASLVLIVLLLCGLYLTYNTYGNFQFAWMLRGKKVAAFLLVALATGMATISFQTMTQNQFLTPNILGLDSLYVLIQTLLFFIVGGVNMLSQEQTSTFLISILLMALLSLLLAKVLLKRQQNDLFILLMLGMIFGTLFSSTSNFLQVMMDPNEYDLLQGRLFASFGNINTTHLGLAAGIIILGSLLLFAANRYLDVLHLGGSSDQSRNLTKQISNSDLIFSQSLDWNRDGIGGPYYLFRLYCRQHQLSADAHLSPQLSVPNRRFTRNDLFDRQSIFSRTSLSIKDDGQCGDTIYRRLVFYLENHL